MWNWKKKEEKGPRQVNYLWVLAGGYLMYLGGELIYGVIKGESTLEFFGILAAVVFFLVGGWLCLREWRIYRYGANEEQQTDELPEEADGAADELSDESADPAEGEEETEWKNC